MKTRNRQPELTNAEYAVMQALWKHGQKSVREIHGLLLPAQGWAVTTIRTMLERMAKKGLVKKEDSHGIFVYSPLISRPAGLASIVRFFARRVLETDVSKVVAMFSDAQGLTREEIRELKKILDAD